MTTVTLDLPRQIYVKAAQIANATKRPIDQVVLPGYTPDPGIRPEPARKGGNKQANNGCRRNGAKAANGNPSLGRSRGRSGSKGRNWRSAAA